MALAVGTHLGDKGKFNIEHAELWTSRRHHSKIERSRVHDKESLIKDKSLDPIATELQ